MEKEREKKKEGSFDLKVNECFGAFSRQRVRELMLCQRRYRAGSAIACCTLVAQK